MTNDRPEIVTDEDRWGYIAGSRFVGPDEWRKYPIKTGRLRIMHIDHLVEGFALAADNDGLLLNHQPPEFYAGPLSDAMRDEYDPADWQLTYDRFSAAALMDGTFALMFAGFLATRGNGDSVDYRLTLPPK